MRQSRTTMRAIPAIGLLALLLGPSGLAQAGKHASPVEARAALVTELRTTVRDTQPLPKPPEKLFRIVKYPTALGDMSAYLSVPRDPEKKAPAMIWITGGFPAGGGGSYLWESEADPDNDQSARQYREAGLVMMYPALRGGAGNPGNREDFLGEVDDVIAAAQWLRKQEFVDSEKIYLGGHSTGGTLVLLVAESTELFAGVVSLGPVPDPAWYGADSVVYRVDDPAEARARAPIHYLDNIKTPTFVIEGGDGNYSGLIRLRAWNTSPAVRFIAVPGADHFNVIAPANSTLAELFAKGSTEVDPEALRAPFAGRQKTARRGIERKLLQELRMRDGVKEGVHSIRFYLVGPRPEALKAAVAPAKKAGFSVQGPLKMSVGPDQEVDVLLLTRKLNTSDPKVLSDASGQVDALQWEHGLEYWGYELAR